MNNHALLEAQYALLVLRQAKVSSREVAIKLLHDLARQSEYFGSGNPVIAIECGAAGAAIRAPGQGNPPGGRRPGSALAKRFRNSGEMEEDFRIEISSHLFHRLQREFRAVAGITDPFLFSCSRRLAVAKVRGRYARNQRS